jgi:hypothetical protein
MATTAATAHVWAGARRKGRLDPRMDDLPNASRKRLQLPARILSIW